MSYHVIVLNFYALFLHNEENSVKHGYPYCKSWKILFFSIVSSVFNMIYILIVFFSKSSSILFLHHLYFNILFFVILCDSNPSCES